VAEEKAEAKPAAEAAPAAPKQKPTIFIALAVINMLVVGAVGFMVYSGKKKEEASKDGIEKVIEGEAAEQMKEAQSQEFIGKLVPLESFLVNLSGSRGRKLAKINMELEVNNIEVQEEIQQLKPKIRDIIIIILSSKTYSQVSNTDGKEQLREEIRDQVNLFLTKGQISKVYFTEFIFS